MVMSCIEYLAHSWSGLPPLTRRDSHGAQFEEVTAEAAAFGVRDGYMEVALTVAQRPDRGQPGAALVCPGRHNDAGRQSNH